MNTIDPITETLADRSAELDKAVLSAKADGIEWDDGDVLSVIPWAVAEQVAGQYRELEAAAEALRERAAQVTGLHALACWLEGHDVGTVYGLDSLVFLDSVRLNAIAADTGLDVKVAPFGGSGEMRPELIVSFPGPVKLRLVGQPVEEPCDDPFTDVSKIEQPF
jgi:hypothetical protein